MGYRNKIFIGTSDKKAWGSKDIRAKCSYKNLLVPEDQEWPEISDSEKVPIKIGEVIIVRYAIGGRDIPDY